MQVFELSWFSYDILIFGRSILVQNSTDGMSYLSGMTLPSSVKKIEHQRRGRNFRQLEIIWLHWWCLNINVNLELMATQFLFISIFSSNAPSSRRRGEARGKLVCAVFDMASSIREFMQTSTKKVMLMKCMIWFRWSWYCWRSEAWSLCSVFRE